MPTWKHVLTFLAILVLLLVVVIAIRAITKG